jgi:LacI family transcriptional regulator
VSAIRSRPRPTVTLRDVARLADVHPGTVSRALNERTRALVSPDTAQRVIAAAEELGYRPNPIARGLKTNRSYTVGVLVPDLTNPLFPPIVRGIEDRLGGAGYTSLIASTDNDPVRERLDVTALRARHVDGFISATARRDDEIVREMLAAGEPVVLVNGATPGGAAPSVTTDDRTGARLAVDHLVALGHREIAHLGGPQTLATGHRRLEAFVAAMRAAGIEPDPRLIRCGATFSEEEGAWACRELLEDGLRFTAIVAGNDLMALGCYDVLRERGLRCPEDVSVVGCNDIRFADRFDPPLTTVRLPHHEVGATAAELLLERLEDPDAAPRHVLVEPDLVVRASTGPA